MSGTCALKRLIFSVILVITLSSFLTIPAIAQGTKQSDHSLTVQTSENNQRPHETAANGDNRGDLTDLFYRFINFTLLVVILFIVVKKTKLSDQLSMRGEEIRQRLSDLHREKEDAENRYRETEARLKAFEIDRKEILEQYKKEGLAEKDKIISQARKSVKQILEQSELAIRQEVQSARDQLKQEVAGLAAQRAGEIIDKELDEKDQDNLVNEFIEKVGKAN
jgi:F-type H+-transporting ATPase subunit b